MCQAPVAPPGADTSIEMSAASAPAPTTIRNSKNHVSDAPIAKNKTSSSCNTVDEVTDSSEALRTSVLHRKFETVTLRSIDPAALLNHKMSSRAGVVLSVISAG